jgi:hypothetical protein
VGQRIIVTGRLQDHQIPALMRHADLFLFPPLADTLPLVVFEALSYGLPVLASEVGGIPTRSAKAAACCCRPATRRRGRLRNAMCGRSGAAAALGHHFEVGQHNRRGGGKCKNESCPFPRMVRRVANPL